MIEYIIILIFYLVLAYLYIYYKKLNTVKIHIPIENILHFPILENLDIIPNNDSKKASSNKCCLVKKEYVEDSTYLFGGKFIYKYNKLENDKCYEQYFDFPPNEILQEGYNWNNEDCIENNDKLGSCRLDSNKCIDFYTKDECDKYKMIWSNKTCNEKLDINFNQNNNNKVNLINNSPLYIHVNDQR